MMGIVYLVGSAAKWRIGVEPLAINLPADVAGSIPGWGTFGVALTFFTLWLRGALGFGQQTNEAAANIRQHYAQELSRLADRLDNSDQMHAECVREREELRDGQRALKDELAGIKRQIALYSANQLQILENCPPSEAAPHAAASAERVKKIAGEEDK